MTLNFRYFFLINLFKRKTEIKEFDSLYESLKILVYLEDLEIDFSYILYCILLLKRETRPRLMRN